MSLALFRAVGLDPGISSMCSPIQLLKHLPQKDAVKTYKSLRATMTLRNSPEGDNLGSHWLYWNAIGPSQAEVGCSRGREEKRLSFSEDKQEALWKGNWTTVAWG